MVPSNIAPSFEILELTIGKSSQLVNAKFPVPAQTWTEVARDVEVRFQTCQVGQDISMVVRNIGEEPLVFRAAAVGHAVE